MIVIILVGVLEMTLFGGRRLGVQVLVVWPGVGEDAHYAVASLQLVPCQHYQKVTAKQVNPFLSILQTSTISAAVMCVRGHKELHDMSEILTALVNHVF